MNRAPYYILGPCAAETEEQTLATAKAIAQVMAQQGVSHWIFRAGLWKPRTSPTTFQGIGNEGLAWLQRIQNELGLPCATEVATPDQLRAALDAGIRHLWIGARTSANPIQVQTLADALNAYLANSSEAIRIYIKNPVNNDPALWIGNIQRFQEALNLSPYEGESEGVFAVHRGCNHRPCWEMAYTLRQQLPAIPLLLDPSHMSGDVHQVASLCHIAEQLEYDGYMIEVHPDPAHALSDARQQLTPEQLDDLLIGQSPTNRTNISGATPLRWLRQMMDEVDNELWNAIAKRMEVSRRIGAYKREQHMDIVQPTRYEQMLAARLDWAQSHDLDANTVRAIMDALHQASIRIQQ